MSYMPPLAALTHVIGCATVCSTRVTRRIGNTAGDTILQPMFPLLVLSIDNDDWLLRTPEEVANNLEWFDSEDGDESVVVVDWEGRPVSVKVEALEIKRLELKEHRTQDVPETLVRLNRLRASAA